MQRKLKRIGNNEIEQRSSVTGGPNHVKEKIVLILNRPGQYDLAPARFHSYLKPFSEMGMKKSQKAGKWGSRSVLRFQVGQGEKPPEAESFF